MMASKLFILVPAYNANATCFSLMREPVRLRYRTYNALKKWKIDLLSIQPDSISCVVMVYSGFVPSEKELSYLLKMKKNGAQPLWLKHFNMVQIKSHKFKEKCVQKITSQPHSYDISFIYRWNLYYLFSLSEAYNFHEHSQFIT